MEFSRRRFFGLFAGAVAALKAAPLMALAPEEIAAQEVMTPWIACKDNVPTRFVYIKVHGQYGDARVGDAMYWHDYFHTVRPGRGDVFAGYATGPIRAGEFGMMVVSTSKNMRVKLLDTQQVHRLGS